VAEAKLDTAKLGAAAGTLAPCDAGTFFARGGGSGAARTTLGRRVPASESDWGVASGPNVTSAGRLIAAANAVPATAAVAMIVSPLLTHTP
jgi:hypothetical protein